MEWWQAVIQILAFIAAGMLFGEIISYIIERFVRKRETASLVDFVIAPFKNTAISGEGEEPLRLDLTDLLSEARYNLKIAKKNQRNILKAFRKLAWNSCQHELSRLPPDLQYSLSQVYVYIDLANSLTLRLTESGGYAPELENNLGELNKRIAGILAGIEPLLKDVNRGQRAKHHILFSTKIAFARPRKETRILEAVIYLLGITVAHVVGIFDVAGAILCHIIIIIVIVLHSTYIGESLQQRLILPLSLVPLLGVIRLIAPLSNIPPVLLYYFSYAPVLVAAVFIIGRLGYTPRQVGVSFKRFPIQLLMGLTGILFAFGAYSILVPEPVVAGFTLQDLWLPALVLLFTGFMPEFIFRGIIQRSSTQLFGLWGIVFVSLLYTVTYIGFLPAAGLALVFVMSLFYGWVVNSTGSLLGVSLSSGIGLVLLYLVFPFVI